MTTYGDQYRKSLDEAQRYVTAARQADSDGDLWQAKVCIMKAIENMNEAERLLMVVSKVAFERVLGKEG